MTPAGSLVRPFLVLLVALGLTAVACGSAETAVTTAGTSTATDVPEADEDPGRELDIQGHRGARGLQPENTLPAFETALDLGVSTLELDLHLTSDGVPVVWHDPMIDAGKCGLAPGAVGPDPDDPLTPDEELMIRRLSRNNLDAYVCDRNPDPGRFPDQSASPTALAGGDYRIPSLAEVFDFVAAYSNATDKTPEQRENAAEVEFNVETKRKVDDPSTIGDGFDGTNAGPFEIAILDAVSERNLGGRVVIQSFDHRSIWAVLATEPGIRVAALTSRRAPDLGDYAARGASIWSPNEADVTDQRIAEAHDLGLLVIPWTINDADEMQDLIRRGVDGIITDRPDIALSL